MRNGPSRFPLAGVIALVVVGLAGGFVLARQFAPAPAPAAAELDERAAPVADVVASVPRGAPVAEDRASPARAVVESFLSAEVSGDHAASWELLDDGDREDYGTLAQWIHGHADLPPIDGFTITGVQERDGKLEVIADLQLRSQLNEFTGLVPARATGAFPVVAHEGARPRVAFGATLIAPVYPSSDAAGREAEGWARAMASSCTEPAGGYDGPVYGVPTLAQQLCTSAGEVALGAVTTLPEGEQARPFISAFGPDVFAWARVVPVTVPAAMRLVLAPVDDTWTVVGVLPPQD